MGAVADGKTMVHELGHFAGLFHTTEMGGTFHDPLSDTPECFDTSNVLACPDRNNIMFATFWGATGGVGIEASEHQRPVLHAGPLYRAAPANAPRVLSASTTRLEHDAPDFSPVEARLLANLCGHAPRSQVPTSLAAHEIEELKAIAQDPKKARILRQRAGQTLRRTTAASER